jgi:hypothetical protein
LVDYFLPWELKKRARRYSADFPRVSAKCGCRFCLSEAEKCAFLGRAIYPRREKSKK